MRSIFQQFKGVQVGILAALLIMVLTYLGLFSNLLQRLEYWALDYRFRLAGKNPETSNIVIIAIDDGSIQKLGPWPWPRSYHARLIEILNQARAKVIGFDIIFSSPYPIEDYQLVRAIKNSQNVILVAYPKPPIQMSYKRNIMTVEQLQSPVKEMAQVAKGIGHIAVVYDNDGIVRRAPALLRTRDKSMLAFGIEIALAYQGEQKRRIGLGKESLQVNSIKIPLDSQGNMLINYRGGPHSFTEIPYYRVIDREVPPDVFKNRIVLVGLTAGGLSDSWVTPFIYQGNMSGVEVNANIAHTVLNKGFFIHLSDIQNAFLILLLGIISGLIFYRFPRRSTPFLMFVIFFIISASLYLFLKQRILLETIPLLAVTLATYVPVILIRNREYKMEICKKDLEISAVLKMGEVIKEARGDTEEFLRPICQLIKNLLRVDTCYALLDRGDKPVIIDEGSPRSSGYLVDQEIAQKVFQTGEPVLRDKKASGVGGTGYVPIKSANHVYGVLFLERNGSLDYRDLQLASIFTDYITFVLEKKDILRKTQEAYIQAVQALTNVMEAKHPYIYRHATQVLRLAEKMAEILDASKEEVEVIRYAALLHDLGMTEIPEAILSKTDPLTVEERLYLESHPDMGIELIRPLTFLKAALPIIRYHHERYDGKGYPEGLAGDEIPLGSQILGVADSFVAMTSDRPYRKSREPQEAISEIKRQSGFQFNPRVVKSLLKALEQEEGK